MVITTFDTPKRVLLSLLKDFSAIHTVSSLAKELHLSRVGVWKVLKRLEADTLILIKPVGLGKTSTLVVELNWDNLLLKKTMELLLTEEAVLQKRWRANFLELEPAVSFLILYGSILHSPKDANDIDLIGVVSLKNKFFKIQQIIDKIQKTQTKKIHLLNFTKQEFRSELSRPNKVYIDAIRKGTVLYGEDNFFKFIGERY